MSNSVQVEKSMIENCRYTYHVLGIAENVWKDQWYIGSRTATHGRTPEEDIGIHYFTSSRDDNFKAQFKAHPEWFVCTILERGYSDDVVMGEDEARRITESWKVSGRINRAGRLPLFERDERYQEEMRKIYASPEYRAKLTAAMRKVNASPEYQEMRRKMYASPEWKAKQAAGARKNAQDPEYQEMRRKMYAKPEWKAKQAAGARKNAQDPEYKAKNAAANRKLAQDPVWKAKNAAANRKKAQDPVWKANHAATMRKVRARPEFGKRISDGIKRARALREAASSTVSC